MVTTHYPLTQEEAGTEWLSGCLELRLNEEGILMAYYKGQHLK
jgi:hypothetical protein